MNFRPNLNSITTRLILLGTLLLIAGALGRIFLLSDYLRKDVTELTSAQLLTLANYVAKDIDRDIVERREYLQRVAAKMPLSLLQNRTQLQAWLAERYDINPLFSQGIAVLDTSGVVLADYPVLPDHFGKSFAGRDYFQLAMKGAFAIGCPVIGLVSKVPILPMAMPLRESGGKIRAVLVGASALNSPSFINTLYSTRVGTQGGLVLVSPRDKLFVGASDMDIALKPLPKEGTRPQHDRAMKGFRGAGVDVNAQGVEELTAIASVPSADWFVVARLPTSEAFAPISRLHHFIANNTLLTVPFFVLLIVFGLRYLLRPLTNAADHADRMTLGEIPLELLPVVRDDEVGHLTTAFNRVLTKMLESQAELVHIAHHDTLTGLPNRKLLTDRMELALMRAKRSRSWLAVLFLDLDGFKPINDGYGHEAGDAALREVAARVSVAIRGEDTLARVGGDEFVILLSDLNEHARESAELVANKCLEVFQQPFVICGQSCCLGISIGIVLGDGACSPDKLLIAADQAMYRAKEAGRGKFFWAEDRVVCSTDDIPLVAHHT